MSDMAHYPICEVTINVVFKSFILVRSLAARGGCSKCEIKWHWLLDTYLAQGYYYSKET